MERFTAYSRILATGAPAPNSSVDVYNTGTLVHAPIFSDDGITPLANPFTSDASGLLFFYAADGDYDVRNSGGGIVAPYTWGDITLGPGVTGNHTWTGVQTFSTPIAVASGGTGLNASTVLDGQLLIGNDGANNFTLATLTGTANQVVVANGAGSVTLSLPQSINTGASVGFATLSLSGLASINTAAGVGGITVGDSNFTLAFDFGGAGIPALGFDNNDRIQYNRGTDTYQFIIATNVELTLAASGLQVTDGLVVGFSGVPTAAAVSVGDTNLRLSLIAGDGYIQFQAADSDYFRYVRASDTFQWVIAGVAEMALTASGLAITNGLAVGFVAAPTDDAVSVADANFRVDFSGGGASIPGVVFDANDFFAYDRTSNFFHWTIGSTEEMRLDATGLQVTNGLNVGFAGAIGDDRVAVGDATLNIALAAGVATYTVDANDDLMYTRATNTWDLRIAAANIIEVTNAVINLGPTGAVDIRWGKALVAMGGGAAPTLGTIGGAGPAVAGQNTWLRVLDSAGVAAFIPVWK